MANQSWLEGQDIPESEIPSWLLENEDDLREAPVEASEPTSFDVMPAWLTENPMEEVTDINQVDERNEQLEWVGRINFYFHVYNQKYIELKKRFVSESDEQKREELFDRIVAVKKASRKYFEAMRLIQNLDIDPEKLNEAIKIYNEGVVDSRDADLPMSYSDTMIDAFKDSEIRMDYNNLVTVIADAYISTDPELIAEIQAEEDEHRVEAYERVLNQVMSVFAKVNNIIPVNYVPAHPGLADRDDFLAKLTFRALQDPSIMDAIKAYKGKRLNELIERLTTGLAAK